MMMIITPPKKYIDFQAIDEAGNLSEIVTKVFAVDTEAPVWRETYVVKTIPSSRVYLNLDVQTGLVGSGIKEYLVEYKSEGGEWESLEVEEYSFDDITHRATINDSGEYFIRAKAIDWAGHQSV